MGKSVTGFGLECQKARRTGLAAAFVAGGILAAAFPVLNMFVRAGIYTELKEAPVKILLDANWQMMAMINLLLAAAGACMIYHTEYEYHALQKMCTLPFSEGRMFFGKAVLLSVFCAAALLIEAGALFFCARYWFGEDGRGLAAEILKQFLWSFFMMLPVIAVSLGIACAGRNLWISLGICVVCVFTATLLPAGQFVLSLFPFALPFQMLSGDGAALAQRYAAAAAAETVAAAAAGFLFLKVRRDFS